jgi:hypothetical protein
MRDGRMNKKKMGERRGKKKEKDAVWHLFILPWRAY